MLAAQLMSEALRLAYVEPDDPPTMGRESGETSGFRAGWDDVDDFDGLDNSPPLSAFGPPLPNVSAAWRREVSVVWADPANPSATSGTDQGLKRITVTVRKNGAIVGQVVSLRSNR